MATTKGITEGKIAGLYELERTLGRGHFAVVKLGRHVFTRQLVAVKIIDKTKLDALAMGHLLQEVRCMKLVQHPNVVRLYEVIDTHTKLYLILELADGGDLYDYILRHEGGVAEPIAKVHFAQIVRAIAYCHRLHVVHRDLKPENVVFFRQQGAVKLTDFGFSNHFQPGTMLLTSCGSLAYSAPEILLGEEYDAPAVDIWSLGVILYMLVCGRPPFQEANDSETLIMIMDCRYSIPPHVSEECRDLISQMLQRDPQRRAPLQDIESHLWLQDVETSPSPLSSDCSPSAQEHEVILQAMSSGNIAERDAVQEESDSEPSALVEKAMDVAPVALLAPASPAGPRRGVCESGDLLASKLSRQDPTFSEVSSSGSCLAVSVRSVAPTPPTLLRSLGSLHQICEEEEDEEEEVHPQTSGTSQDSAMRGPDKEIQMPPSGTLNTEGNTGEPAVTAENQQRAALSQNPEKPNTEGAWTSAEDQNHLQKTIRPPATSESSEPAADHKQNQLQNQHQLESFGEPTNAARDQSDEGTSDRTSSKHEGQCNVLQKRERPATGPGTMEPTAGSEGQEKQTEDHQEEPSRTRPHPAAQTKNFQSITHDAVHCCWGSSDRYLDPLEDNNNAPSRPSDPRLVVASCTSPCFSPNNHCVALRLDAVETRRLMGEATEQTERGQRQRGSGDCSADPGKNKNLRERLLQFPLCEKALTFNIQPTSKEKLLPFAQYNCCRVL